AIVLMQLHRSVDAIPEFQAILQEDQRNLKAQVNFAAALFELKRFTEAADAYALAVALSPTDPDLHANLALALEKAGRAADPRKEVAEAKRLRNASSEKPR